MQTLALFLLISALELSPAPQHITPEGREVFRLTPTTPVIVADDAGDDIRIGLRQLFDTIGYELPVFRATGFRPGDFGIYIGAADTHASYDHRRMRRRVRAGDLVQPESYRISIWRNGVVVAGADDAGTWYGLQTLKQIVDQAPMQWPALEIQDAPDLPLRGTVVQGMLSNSELEALAATRCNLILFDHPDFADLSGMRAEVWQRVFEHARALHMEPVPILPIADRAERLLEQAPQAVEALTRREEVTLRSDDWVALHGRNILVSDTTPVEVRVSNILLEEQVDYSLEYDPLQYPYPSYARPFLIRRIPGGGIPNGATVEVRYSHVPPGSAALCPHAAATETVLRESIRKLVTALDPNFLHLDLATVQRAGQDIRCQHGNPGGTPGQALNQLLRLAENLLQAEKEQARIMLWDDLLHPDKAATYGVSPGDLNLSGRSVVIARALDARQLRDSALHATRRHLDIMNRSFLLRPAANTPQAHYHVANLFPADTPSYRGILMNGAPDSPGFRMGMEKAWSLTQPRLVWPERMNSHLHSNLWRPTYPERLQALITHYNRNSIQSIAPMAVHEGIQTALQLASGQAYNDPEEAEQLRSLSENIAEYLSLESEYQRSGDHTLLRRLSRIISTQTQLDPMMDREREERILQNVEGQGLFVPASILFGEQLLYYRRQNLPPHLQLLEVPVQPEFRDELGQVRATLDFGAAVAPIMRIDYETVAAEQIRLSAGGSLNNLQGIETWERDGVSVLRGPALLRQAQAARYFQMEVSSAAEQAVLRELRAFALKPVAELHAPDTMDFSTQRNPQISELIWPQDPQGRGFVNAEAERFAEVPTEFRVLWNRSHLLLRVDAIEPRLQTMVSQFTERDAALWEQESIEILLSATPHQRYRFVVNPEGVQFDSRNGDRGWEGDWEVQARQRDDGWVAYVLIPFADLDAYPRAGERWGLNVIRNRHNVVQEQSIWAWERGDVPATPSLGALYFE